MCPCWDGNKIMAVLMNESLGSHQHSTNFPMDLPTLLGRIKIYIKIKADCRVLKYVFQFVWVYLDAIVLFWAKKQ